MPSQQGHERGLIYMARKGISKENVARAVMALRAKGRPITTRVVRLELENHGSYGTIGRFLEELGAKSKATPPAMPALPEGLQKEFANAVFSMWQASSDIAAKRVGEIETECEQRVHTLSIQLTKERELRERLEVELCSASADLSACKQREHLFKEEAMMLRQELRIQKALHQRAERDRDTMLKQLAPMVRVASRNADDTTSGKEPKNGNGAKLHINRDSHRPGA